MSPHTGIWAPLVNFWSDVRVKVAVAVVSTLIVSWGPTIYSDLAYLHNSRLETTNVVRDYPVQKALVAEKIDALRKQVDHLVVLVEQINANTQKSPVVEIHKERRR